MSMFELYLNISIDFGSALATKINIMLNNGTNIPNFLLISKKKNL